MAPRGDKGGSPGTLLAVLAAAAILAGVLFWQLNRQTSAPEPAGAGGRPQAGALAPGH